MQRERTNLAIPMFGWFAPQCPVDSAAKQWIELRLNWLMGQFGREVFTHRELILPTDAFFPDPFMGSEACVRRLLDRVCGYMDIEPRRVQLKLMTQKKDLWLVNDKGRIVPTTPGGLYDQRSGQTVIHIDTDELLNLSGLVGTMAHELSHHRLMGENRVSGEMYDNELLTDLTAVYFGFGVFLGGSPRNWDSMYTTWPGTTLRRPEYMTPPMYAYALAHRAWHRGERKPTWSRSVPHNLRPSFAEGVRFLFATDDSTFRPKTPPPY